MAVLKVPQCDFGLPGGSGTWMTRFPEDLNRPETRVVAYYREGFATPFGTSAPAKLVDISGAHALTFAMHGWHQDRRAPMSLCAKQVAWCFMQAGVKMVLLAASVGGIQNPDRPGERLPPWSVGTTTGVIAPWALRNTEEPPFGFGALYPRMAQPTCPVVNQILLANARKHQWFVGVYDQGVYAGTDGRLETVDEIKTFATMGAHIVGQTFQHEFHLWRQLGLHVGHLWIVSNHAENGGIWIANQDYSQDWEEFYRACAIPCGHILIDSVEQLAFYEPKDCQCHQFAVGGGMSPVDYPDNWSI